MGGADRGDVVPLITNSTYSLLICRMLGIHGKKLQTSGVNAQVPDSKIASNVALPQLSGPWELAMRNSVGTE